MTTQRFAATRRNPPRGLQGAWELQVLPETGSRTLWKGLHPWRRCWWVDGKWMRDPDPFPAPVLPAAVAVSRRPTLPGSQLVRELGKCSFLPYVAKRTKHPENVCESGTVDGWPVLYTVYKKQNKNKNPQNGSNTQTLRRKHRKNSLWP